ncbi:MAG: hypothetical protein IKS49_01995 [Actinomycetaceae bacterium]|nr:hypothetical protein [Actinomycetaceae bacterium]
MAADHSLFASKLNKCLAASSLSAEDVVLELNKYGFPVPQHTFSYWLQGYFLPRSEAAFQLVDVLESVLGVSDASLSDALLVDLSSGLSFVPGENVQTEASSFSVAHRRFSSVADDATDWEATVIQKVVRDEVVLSADWKTLTQEVTIFARVPTAPNPFFSFQLYYEDGCECPGREDVFYDLSGVTLKKCDVSKEDGRTIYIAHFSLPDDVVPGDLYKFSYKWDEKHIVAPNILCNRFVPWSLDFYSCSVTFEGGIPRGIRYVTCENRGDEDVEVPNDIPLVRDGNTVSVSIKNFGNIIGYFELPEPTLNNELNE